MTCATSLYVQAGILSGLITIALFLLLFRILGFRIVVSERPTADKPVTIRPSWAPEHRTGIAPTNTPPAPPAPPPKNPSGHDESKKVVIPFFGTGPWGRVFGDEDTHRAAQKFWSEIYPEGMTAEDIGNELSDYRVVIDGLDDLVYHVTGGKASKPNTAKSVIISLHDDHVTEVVREAVEEAVEETKAAMNHISISILHIQNELARKANCSQTLIGRYTNDAKKVIEAWEAHQ